MPSEGRAGRRSRQDRGLPSQHLLSEAFGGKKQPSRPAKPQGPHRRPRALVLAMILVFGSAGAMAIDITLRAASRDLSQLPAEVHGLWTTSHVQYADRALELRADVIVFHAGGDRRLRYPIVAVRRDGGPESAAYRIRYGSRVEPFELAFYFTRAPRAQLVLRNQDGVVWTRADSAR